MPNLKLLGSVTQGTRHVVMLDRGTLWKGGPFIKEVLRVVSHSGRDGHGHVVVRHRGNFKYRSKIRYLYKHVTSDFIVIRPEYIPRRRVFGLLVYSSVIGYKYVLKVKGLLVGDVIRSNYYLPGLSVPISKVPHGFLICNTEHVSGLGGCFGRSAGVFLSVLTRVSQGLCTVRLPSGIKRLLSNRNLVTLGSVSNLKASECKYGKAGTRRNLGVRPSVRGVAMNPIDHPHGGGEGKTASGRHPVTPWGKLTKGKKTRKRNSYWVV